MRHPIVKAVLALTCLAVPAQAQRSLVPVQREGSWELSIGAGGTYLDWYVIHQVQLTDPAANRIAPGAAASLSYHLSRMFSLSAGIFAGYTKPALVLQPYGAISWTPNINAKISPFITLHGGVTNITWSGYKATAQYGGGVGAGFRFSLGDRMALRLEGREQYEKYSDATVFPKPVFNGTGSLGLSFFFGGRRVLVASVGVSPRDVTLEALGATQQLAASPKDRTGRALARRAVAWSSSNDSVATVSDGGVVTAVGNGTATITATSEGATGTTAVTVAQMAASLTVSPETATLTALGQTQQLAVTGQDANNNALSNAVFTWSSNNPAVSVSATGLATAVRNGTATITAMSGTKSATASLTVRQATATVSVTPAMATINTVGGRVQFTAQANDASGRPVTGRVITWTDSAVSVATLSPTGLATAVGNGTAKIMATVDGVTSTAILTVALPAGRVAAAPPPAAAAGLPGATGATVVLRNVSFQPNRSVLPQEARASLDEVAQAMKTAPGARWEIGGYTSSMGNAARNLLLSRRRAQAVRTYLIRQGVPAASLVAVGYGSQNPIATNRTVAGRRQNMRVEIKRLR